MISAERKLSQQNNWLRFYSFRCLGSVLQLGEVAKPEKKLSRKTRFHLFRLLGYLTHVSCEIKRTSGIANDSPENVLHFGADFLDIGWKMSRADFFTPLSAKCKRYLNLRHCRISSVIEPVSLFKGLQGVNYQYFVGEGKIIVYSIT